MAEANDNTQQDQGSIIPAAAGGIAGGAAGYGIGRKIWGGASSKFDAAVAAEKAAHDKTLDAHIKAARAAYVEKKLGEGFKAEKPEEKAALKTATEEFDKTIPNLTNEFKHNAGLTAAEHEAQLVMAGKTAEEAKAEVAKHFRANLQNTHAELVDRLKASAFASPTTAGGGAAGPLTYWERAKNAVGKVGDIAADIDRKDARFVQRIFGRVDAATAQAIDEAGKPKVAAGQPELDALVKDYRKTTGEIIDRHFKANETRPGGRLPDHKVLETAATHEDFKLAEKKLSEGAAAHLATTKPELLKIEQEAAAEAGRLARLIPKGATTKVGMLAAAGAAGGAFIAHSMLGKSHVERLQEQKANSNGQTSPGMSA